MRSTAQQNPHYEHMVPQWVFDVHKYRSSWFLTNVEPMIVKLLGPLEEQPAEQFQAALQLQQNEFAAVDVTHRRLFSFLPNYVEDVSSYRESSMSFATLAMLFGVMSCLFLVFISCFYHNQKTSPLFISPRRHRLPKLVPPPLPVDGFCSWVKVCFFLNDEEIINHIGYDSLIFLRFHRLALRCIVKMSVFSFAVIIPLNFTGGGHANATDLKGYVGSLLFTDFLRFTMANISGGSPRLWVHCFGAYLLTGIVVRELLIEYEAFNAIRHRYLLSREPHLRSVLVTNIPKHLRAPGKIENYFRHVYPDAVKSVNTCQNLLVLESLIKQRTSVLASIESELLLLCRTEKRKLFQQNRLQTFATAITSRLGFVNGSQERITQLYTTLEDFNNKITRERQRRQQVMKKLDRMEAWDGRRDIDYLLASPFIAEDPQQRRILGLASKKDLSYRPPTIGAPRNSDGSITNNVSEGVGETNKNTRVRFEAHASSNPPTSGISYRAKSSVTNNASNMGDGLMKTGPKKKKRPFHRARQAIARYSRLAREVTFFGRPVGNTLDPVDQSHIEDHTNEVTDKAFITMNTFTASTIAIQSMHSSRPGSMQVVTAPEPRDVLWENIYVSKGATRTRSFIGEALVLLLIGFYVIPMALVSLLVSESALVSSSPRLAQLAEASAFFYFAIAVIQPICIVALQQTIPPLFILIGRLEGIVSFSAVQQRAFSRYFLFQVINVFLVTTFGGAIFDTIALIVENPEAAFEILGNSLPRLSSFFITFVTIKTFCGLGFELVRTMSLIQASLRFILFPNSTLRASRNVRLGMRAIDDPGWFPFHKILAQDMLVVVISVVFAVVAPLVLFPCALFCLFSRIIWTHHHLYVYESVFETGGQFWPKVFRRFVFGLIIAQMTITGQFILKEARHQAYATIALMFMTYIFLRSARARYDATSSTLPLEVATLMDISIAQEREEAAKRNLKRGRQDAQPQTPEATASFERNTQTTSSIPDSSPGGESNNEHLGIRVGHHDPFELAYVQPALRANPRAKPEQPFPPSQLGREELLLGQPNLRSETISITSGGYDDARDSGATVRLKSLHQHDRRLINRWWNDQFQRCGKQHFISVLTGEECGNLMIGNRSNLVELRTQDGGGV